VLCYWNAGAVWKLILHISGMHEGCPYFYIQSEPEDIAWQSHNRQVWWHTFLPHCSYNSRQGTRLCFIILFLSSLCPFLVGYVRYCCVLWLESEHFSFFFMLLEQWYYTGNFSVFLWALIMHYNAVYKNFVLHLERDIFSFLFGGWQCNVIFCWEWRS
jgi:hypothetical protein